MDTFLKLCQKTASRSGVVSGVNPLTTTNQTGMNGKIVGLVRDAWIDVQNHRKDWKWMWRECTAQTIQGFSRYTPSDLLIMDLATWVTDGKDHGRRPMSIFPTVSGRAYETPVMEITFDLWQYQYDRGEQTNSQPMVYAIAPDNRLCLGPTPDGIYTLRGAYFKTPQILMLDNDLPVGLPEGMENIIMYRALMFMAESDEAASQIQSTATEYNTLLTQLVCKQTQGISWGAGSLA